MLKPAAHTYENDLTYVYGDWLFHIDDIYDD